MTVLRRLSAWIPTLIILSIVFSLTYAAAAKLVVSVPAVPQVGSGSGGASCQTDPLVVRYQVDRVEQTAVGILVGGISTACGDGSQMTVALQSSSTYFPGGVNYQTLGLTGGDTAEFRFDPAISLLSFTTGDVTIVIDASAGVVVVP